MTKKTLLYRASYRVDGGQHQVWCSKTNRGGEAESVEAYLSRLRLTKSFSPEEVQCLRIIFPILF